MHTLTWYLSKFSRSFAFLLGSTLLLSLLASSASAIALSSEVVASGLNRPVFVTSPVGDERLFIVEQRGVIQILSGGSVLATPFLDIDALVTNISGNDERGLLGLAFHPDYANNGYFYVNYTDNNSDTKIVRYGVSGDPNLADPASAEILLTIDQPFSNHNGGMLAFGPNDGYLYIGMGDGGSGGDPGNRAQNLQQYLGKMLRIDVDGQLPYTIPPSNPFVNDANALDEIWAYGLRNPWRWSFNRENGDLWIGDVGQSQWEEIDFQSAASEGGENYGWRLMEGSHCYNPPSDCNDGSLTLPLWEYSHASGRCSVTGGYVYRGSHIPALQGTYFFADFCSGEIWSFEQSGGVVFNFVDRTAELDPGAGSITAVAGFGEDGFGELYIVERGDATSGEIYRITADPSSADETEPRPRALSLGLPSPNPFSGVVRVQLNLQNRERVQLDALDVAGRVTRQLESADYGTGQHVVSWDGRDGRGRSVRSGVYFLRAGTTGQQSMRPVHVIR